MTNLMPTIREVRYRPDGKMVRDDRGRIVLFSVPPERRECSWGDYPDTDAFITDESHAR